MNWSRLGFEVPRRKANCAYLRATTLWLPAQWSRFDRGPLESDVEPELEGKVMPGLIGEVRTQFPCVAFAQHLGTETTGSCQISHIITILWAVSLQLGQNQIVGVGA